MVLVAFLLPTASFNSIFFNRSRWLVTTKRIVRIQLDNGSEIKLNVTDNFYLHSSIL